MKSNEKGNLPEPSAVEAPVPFRSVFWDDLAEDLTNPEFAKLYAEESAKIQKDFK
jgi:hypothetical protein